MRELLSIIATEVPPQIASILIIILFFIPVMLMILVRLTSKKEIEPFHEFDLSLSANQRKKAREENKRIYIQKCFDETIRLLKQATIKKTYRNSGLRAWIRDQIRIIYTIQLDKKEAVMYIWGNVIAQTAQKEKDRVIHMAAVILSVLEENKNKHILELEAQAVAATRIYGCPDGEDKLQIRAVDNIDDDRRGQSTFPLPSGGRKNTAEKTEFVWPSVVALSVKKLRDFSLLAFTNEDLNSFTVFPCISCKSECSIFDLEDLRCPKCRKK
ncbi:MAG: hypothetical protein ACI4PY_09970 [Akkermansia muciniphila]